MHGTADKVFWNAQAAAENPSRYCSAQATIDFQIAQDTDTVAALGDVNTALALPWTQFLLDRTNAQLTWRWPRACATR